MGVQIEDLTGKVWDNCFQPILNKVSFIVVDFVDLCSVGKGEAVVNQFGNYTRRSLWPLKHYT